MTRQETIIKVLCVFWITMLMTSAIFFNFTIGTPSTIVSWFGFLEIQLRIFHIIAFSTSGGLSLLIAGITYAQWKRDTLYLTKYQLAVYLLVINIGAFFVCTTHSYLLPFPDPLSNFILDILIVIEIVFISLFIILSLWRVRRGREVMVSFNYRSERQEVRELMNRMEDALYEIEKQKAHRAKRFFYNYVAHHFWVGVLLIGMGVSYYLVNVRQNLGVGLIWFITGLILTIDDSINHLFHISFTNLFPHRLKNEKAYDKVGKIFVIFVIVSFLLIALIGLWYVVR